MLDKHKIVILHNIISPYKTLLFNSLYKVSNDLKVLYISETERRREWNIKKDELEFPYEIMFKVPVDEVPTVSLFKRSWKRLNVLNPEVLIIDGYSYASCWAGIFWAEVKGKKIILWSSSNKDDYKRVFYKEFVKRFFVKRCNAYNVYGTRSKEYLLKLGAEKDKVFIVGNNTDNDFFFNETMKLKGEKVVLCQQMGIPLHNFLYVGRFSAEKNILHLLDTYKRLVDKNITDWGLILVGNGPQKEECESYIKKYALKNVLMPDFKQKEELPLYLALSDVFILPSISETWGLVVNEVMAAGLPVLVSRKCGCYPDLVKEEINGFSFDPYDEFALTDLMHKIIQGRVDLEYLGKNSLEIIKEFTPERAARIISNTIEFVQEKESF
jgi:glycosyltransferase involved in cell wall biosynthesis